MVAGDVVLTAAGDTLTIDDVASDTLDVSAVHNLTVDDLHTYYVLAGESAVLVHNCGPDEGIYEFPDAWEPGKRYVGQSGNLPERVGHWERVGRIPDGVSPELTEVLGGRTAREVAEYRRIVELGGTGSVSGSGTSNIRYPVGQSRRIQLEDEFGTFPDPPIGE